MWGGVHSCDSATPAMGRPSPQVGATPPARPRSAWGFSQSPRTADPAAVYHSPFRPDGPCSGQHAGGTGHACVFLQSQQPPPPSQHLPKPKGDAALKMRASLRMTRYLESWGAARPFAHLNHRESISSSETLVPNGRRPKVGPIPLGSWGPGEPVLKGPSS